MEEKKKFKVTDLKSADWVFERIAELEANKNDLEALAEEKIQKIEKWLEGEVKGINGQLEYFKGLIVDYYVEQRATNPRFKLSVPAGAITQRRITSLKYDEKEMINYLKANHQDLVQTVEKFSKNEIKKVLRKEGDVVVDTTTGEIVDWVQAEENTSYSFKVN